MAKTLTLLTGAMVSLFATTATAEVGIGGKPRCPEGAAKFVHTLQLDDLKEIFGSKAKACEAGRTAAYFVCARQKKFDVVCLSADDLESAKKGR